MREAVGVNLSILCSNIRLHASNSVQEADHDNDSPLKTENWAVLLTERASEMVTSIQNTSPSDLGTAAQSSSDNVTVNGDIRDDVKWMETVLITFDLLSL